MTIFTLALRHSGKFVRLCEQIYPETPAKKCFLHFCHGGPGYFPPKASENSGVTPRRWVERFKKS